MKPLNRLEIRTLGFLVVATIAGMVTTYLDHRISRMCSDYWYPTGQPYVAMRAMGSVGIIIALGTNWNRFLDRRWGYTDASMPAWRRSTVDIKMNVAGALVAIVLAALISSYLANRIHEMNPTCGDAHAWPYMVLQGLCVGGIALGLMVTWTDVANRLSKRASKSNAE